ncbi:putative monooxygenase [Podospora didyma]|uniref:Monooxygenase n=1 Tax=Podospora didyma TaxID=330526 RepID=A0AAE0NY40_9PEZI|nr:putative monooxygenase [Podospora didyma]
MPSPKIAIIGAGPSGLLLARLLQLSSLPCTLYEAEVSRSVRNQGGSLDLHPLTGQLALKAAGLWSEFQKHSRPEGEARKLIKFDGSVLWDDNTTTTSTPHQTPEKKDEKEHDRPEIDRVRLRDILLDSLSPGTVQWGKKLMRVESAPDADGKHNLVFSDYTTETGIDLVVGADGAWSKVRPLVTSQGPFYSGITMVELWALDVDARDPWLSQYIGKGSCFMFDEGRALQCQRNGDGSVRCYASLRVSETWLEDCGIDFISENARQELVDRYWADCAEDIKRVILSAKDELTPRKLYMLPVGVKWESKKGVTLMGDAAHLMTPFAGVGVNVALADALDLGRAIVRRKESVVAKVWSDGHNIGVAVEEYEREMFERARVNAEKTAKNLRLHFSKEGGEDMAGRVRAHHDAEGKAKKVRGQGQ